MIEKNYTLSIDKEWMDQESYVYYLFEITCLAKAFDKEVGQDGGGS